MPKILGSSLADHRSLVRASVFDAFAELMGEKSFDAISMSAIAERAGIGRTAIYHHFADTESVLVAFATHETASYVDELRAALEPTEDPEAMLRTYVRHHLAAGEKFHMGLGPAMAGSLSETARLEIRDHITAVEDVLRAIVTTGRDSGVFRVDDIDATLSLIHACLSPGTSRPPRSRSSCCGRSAPRAPSRPDSRLSPEAS
ncbi:TetR/AcrR family transcriptional regulator [Nocardioides sambongensis]|uniref:TetR/AcrR family transcriptional regulator n=1 Tax=Nocardioides sambongensis TaxID=2589074 RepID=UPI001E4B650E|nr:TetR/AcrR family transcriptional regulator [Nocardioides sambongensis]